MFSPPEDYHFLNLMAIDPGINSCGVSCFTIDTKQRKIVSICSYTIRTDRVKYGFESDVEYQDEQVIKLEKLHAMIFQDACAFQPNIAVLEAPFFDRLRPTAFGSLSITFNTIRSAFICVNPQTLIVGLEPKVIKKVIGSLMKGIDKDKSDVSDAVRKIPEIMDVLEVEFHLLDQHAIDSLAIGYSYLKTQGYI